ncbi:MAG TPA: hypothetical protein VNN17_04465, partial [Terriglobia bacterium]|nr:hypothetical protein [Terriglobia bacterium]
MCSLLLAPSFGRVVCTAETTSGTCVATTFSQRIAARKPISPDLASVTAWLTGLSCIAVLLSIALSQILLGAALAGLLLSRRKLDFPARWLLPLLAFAGWTLLSLAFSSEPASGLPQIRKFFVFFLLALVINAFQNHRQLWLTVQGVLSGGVVAALYGLGQFTQDYLALRRQGMEFYENYVVHQITGFMGHWMTYGGQLMLVFFLLLAIRLFAAETLSRAGRWLCWLSMFLVCLALLGAFTRGIWLGTLAAVAYLIAR